MNSREKKRPTAQPVLDRFPLSGREYYALRELFGVVSTFNNCAGELDKRVRSIPGAYRDYRMIQSVAEKLVRKLLTTVPKNKLVQISKELKYTRIVVEVKPEITPRAAMMGICLPTFPSERWKESWKKSLAMNASAVKKRERMPGAANCDGTSKQRITMITQTTGKNARLPE